MRIALDDIPAPDEDGFIRFIHNWCDRRCERCRFVRQCRVGIEEVDDLSGHTPTDAEKETGIIGANLATAWKLLMDRAMEEGVEGEPWPVPDEAWLETRELRFRNAREHPLGKACMAYARMVRDWTAAHKEGIEARGIIVRRAERKALTMPEASPETMVLNEAFEEIAWFQHMLHVKCQRALMGLASEPDYGGGTEEERWQSDWNGTAKLAGIIVDRCASAWVVVAGAFPELEPGIVPILAQLRRCHDLLRREFPDMDRFIRPGFDAPR